jgi:hypothetical protein
MSEHSLLMLPLANLMPPLPGLSGLAGSMKTYAQYRPNTFSPTASLPTGLRQNGTIPLSPRGSRTPSFPSSLPSASKW